MPVISIFYTNVINVLEMTSKFVFREDRLPAFLNVNLLFKIEY